MTDALPGDFDADDGYNDERGLEQCPVCERVYSMNGGLQGPVYDQQGREYDLYIDAAVDRSPFFCADCGPELLTNEKRAENKSLEDWA